MFFPANYRFFSKSTPHCGYFFTLVPYLAFLDFIEVLIFVKISLNFRYLWDFQV
ncbi:hypothetical protein PL8927_600142 [Planktothrix serta PCC 8927]|uniref:Uncharacterized protein n=1 Tax=Planktothrix serta PCC 8927 TaxID=671068 RepID=A0A7Z9BTN3_9CYAN|nr:hypothetical protein PL8927_600142 [Planktothrix serta PCC 8927]